MEEMIERVVPPEEEEHVIKIKIPYWMWKIDIYKIIDKVGNVFKFSLKVAAVYLILKYILHI